ncbi:MAG: ABC transporter permease [Planctomycetes bacterium]|nr:ABC transporter permease [Planctomycetota bacterium]
MNPIIRRELLGALRTRRALAVQAVLATALCALVVLRWPADAVVDLSQTQSRQVLQVFGYGLMICMILLAPVFPAASIVNERLQGTLTLLLNSPMSPWSILIGKLVGAMGFIALLLVLSTPAAAACYAMGGVELSQFLAVYLVLALAAVQYATLALAVSSHAASTDSALRGTYSIILLLAVLTLLPHQFRQGLDVEPLATVIDWVRCISPIPAMMEVLRQGELASQGLAGPGDVAQRYALLALISIVLASLWTGVRLSRRILDRPRPATAMTDDLTASQQFLRRMLYVRLFDPARRASLIGPMTNPVMVKEFRTRRFGRSYWIMRLIALTLVASMGMVLAVTLGTLDWGPATLGAVVVSISCSLILLITPALAAGIISSERQTGGWQLLQMTPLSPVTIVIGKLLSVALPLALVLLATLPAYAVILLIDWDSLHRPVLSTLITLTLMAMFTALSSAAVGSLFRRTAAATVTAYILTLGLTAGTMLVWLGRNDLFSDAVVERVLRFNPVAAALQAIQTPGLVDYELLPDNWWIMAAGCGVSIVVLTLRTWRLTRPQ